jgi:hypothetical protein
MKVIGNHLGFEGSYFRLFTLSKTPHRAGFMFGLLLAATAVGAVAAEQATKSPAFRDLTWGDTITGAFEKVGDPGDGAMLYKRRADKLMVGDAPLKAILYAFRDNRLERVMVMCDPTAVPVLERALIAKYGDPTPAAGQLNWVSENTMISLQPKGVCLFSEKKAVDRSTRERASADRRAADDL